jgi:hypothetical protein
VDSVSPHPQEIKKLRDISPKLLKVFSLRVKFQLKIVKNKVHKNYSISMNLTILKNSAAFILWCCYLEETCWIWGSQIGEYEHVTPCSSGEVHRRFGGTYCLYLQGRILNSVCCLILVISCLTYTSTLKTEEIRSFVTTMDITVVAFQIIVLLLEEIICGKGKDCDTT